MFGKMNAIVSTGLTLAFGITLLAAPVRPSFAAPAKAKTAAVKKKSVKKSSSRTRRKSGQESAAARRAKAMKAYNDYQYVKLLGPISGQMYRSTKW